MKPLWLMDVSGLYQEFFAPDTRSMAAGISFPDQDVVDAGLLFWIRLLGRQSIATLVDALEDNFLDPSNQIPQFQGIIADKERFISNVLDARISACDQGNDPQSFFGKLETLAIVCELYSRFESHPFQLSLHNGFALAEVSAKTVIYNSLNAAHNPYLPFIKETIVPLLQDYAPDVLFCSGKVSHFFIAVARLIKKLLPEIHICFTRHSSEYFSLNKIEGYLKTNDILFSVVDSIVLEYFDESERRLLECLQAHGDISQLENIMSSSSSGRDVVRKSSEKQPSHLVSRKVQVSGLTLSPEQVYDIHFEPNVKCYWNKCAFCGINKKYSHEDTLSDDVAIITRVEQLCARFPDDPYLWFIDEAILPSKLRLIAETLLTNKRRFFWQVRCRIDHGLLDKGLPETLSRAGLRELRLGLESGSLSVLKLMNKFDDTFSLELVERIVSKYDEVGIAVHFPMIIGFPGETELDRHKTYDFLAALKDRHSTVSFNINVFNLDVASLVFKNWDRYSVSEVALPCQPTDFVGNTASWSGPAKVGTALLDRERNAFMREMLYPWMPADSLINPATFYRLSETLRNTLVWRQRKTGGVNFFFGDKVIQLSTALVKYQKDNKEYLFYNWDSHHYFEGGELVSSLLDVWKSPKTIRQGLEVIETDVALSQYKDDIDIYVGKLLHHGHFIELSPSDG